MRCLKHPLMMFAMLGLLLAGRPAAAAQDAPGTHHEREAFARDFAQTVVTILHDHKKDYKDRKDILRRAFVSSVDIDWIAKFVLGRAWRDATDAQRDQYMTLYGKYLTETYVTRFAENPGKSIYSIKILDVRDDEESLFTVHTQMELMNRDNLKVDYRVHDADGSYKVRDFIIENVSLITTHRAEFTELADAQGIDGVIKALETRVRNAKEMSLSME
jgi:phospholipid transport system substrate-binding protein